MREAMVHSTKTIQPVEVIKYNGPNDVIVRTQAGITCSAIDNPFTGLLYADDIYGVKEGGGLS